MDKLKKARQAAWEAERSEFLIDKEISDPGAELGFKLGFDAGVEYQGDWTAVVDGLPKEEREYTVTYSNFLEYAVFDLFWKHSQWNIEPLDGWEIIAWRERFTPYQPPTEKEESK